jgi:hypothetical protein
MVIGKGGSYGTEADIDPTWPSLVSDSELAAHIRANGTAPCTVTSGDLLTTLGGGAPPGVRPRAYPVDLLNVDLDGVHTFVAAAHVVARRSLWAGPFFVAMNAAWVDGLYLGPRSHPNDGVVDVTSGELPLQQRWLARRRAVTGSHLPHPGLSVSRTKHISHRLDRPTMVRIDGRRTVRAIQISVSVQPDAGIVVV